MRKIGSPQDGSAPIPDARLHPGRFSCSNALKAVLLPAAACGILVAPALLPAQTQATHAQSTQAQSATATAPKTPVHHHRPAKPVKAVVPVAPPAPAAVAPPAPEQPKWPAFDPAADASVVWDSHGLRIDAANSSLQQILKEVSLATGVKVDGLTSDQRVFGAYGPGQARDVLSQLLQGSGYNVLMIGDQGGMPRQVLLTARQAASTQPAVRNTPPPSNDDETEAEDPPPPPETPAVRPPFPPGAPPRSPQQFEMQQQRQQQQQQQVNPQD